MGRNQLMNLKILFLCAVCMFIQCTVGEIESLVQPASKSGGHYCPAKNKNITEFSWSLDLPVVAYGCVAQYTELHCCVQGYDQILWFQDNKAVVIHYDKYLINGNQTLKITNTQTNRDRGMYKCQAINSNAEKALENTVKLTVYECIDYTKPPLVMLPRDNGEKFSRELYTEVSIACQAFYGDCATSLCSMSWWKIPASGNSSLILDTNDTHRIYVWEIKTGLRLTGKTKILQIQNITEDDFSRYQCRMASKLGNTTRDAILKQKFPPKPYPEPKNTTKVIIGVVLGLGMMVLLVLVILVAYLRNHKNVIRRMEKKRKIPTDDREYDVTVVSVLADEEQNTVVCENLWNRGFVVYDYSHILEGQDPLQMFSDAIDKSYCVLFLVSSDLIRDPASINLFGFTHKTQTIYRVFIDNLHTLKHEEADQNLATEYLSGVKDLQTVLKVGRSVVWDPENPSFWERLIGYLPKKTAGKQQNAPNLYRENSEHRNLLEGEENDLMEDTKLNSMIKTGESCSHNSYAS